MRLLLMLAMAMCAACGAAPRVEPPAPAAVPATAAVAPAVIAAPAPVAPAVEGELPAREEQPDGTIASGMRRAGHRHGPWSYHTAVGRLVRTEDYVDGVLHGEQVLYRPDGTPDRVRTYVDGVPVALRMHGSQRPSFSR
jgi:hypothetical protein